VSTGWGPVRKKSSVRLRLASPDCQSRLVTDFPVYIPTFIGMRCCWDCSVTCPDGSRKPGQNPDINITVNFVLVYPSSVVLFYCTLFAVFKEYVLELHKGIIVLVRSSTNSTNRIDCSHSGRTIAFYLVIRLLMFWMSLSVRRVSKQADTPIQSWRYIGVQCWKMRPRLTDSC
jgi:hypothetical protein